MRSTPPKRKTKIKERLRRRSKPTLFPKTAAGFARRPNDRYATMADTIGTIDRRWETLTRHGT